MTTARQYRDVCAKALDAISPCVVGWTDATAPQWVKPLAEVVPELQRALDLPVKKWRNGDWIDGD
jgi:hypothetical protein